MTSDPIHLGPVLILDDIRDGVLHLAALFVAPDAPPPVTVGATDVAPVALATFPGGTVWRARFTLPADRAAAYGWNGTRYEVAGDLSGDLALAYVSCNGEEHGDLDRDREERDAMWARLADRHRQRPFALLLHGGDQVYADEVTSGHPLSDDWPDEVPDDPSPEALASLRDHLRARFFDRYATMYRAPDFAFLAARIPSLMQWDDHDICDGWGSLPRSRTYSPVGQTIFAVARETCLLFQHAATDGDLPPRFADRRGRHIGWQVAAPGLRLIAPDLRSERTRRDIMREGGWRMMEAAAAEEVPGRTLLLSSVPLLGPRLSILESLMVVVPRMQKYEDDLRDQWQSRAHRDEWRRMLTLMDRMIAGAGDVTVLSGEIHLATRATMTLPSGRALHQLVASGIAHRAPPKGWARFLGALSTLGEDPLPRHPIRIRRIPGQHSRYVAERNFLVLERASDSWSAVWEVESTGPSPALPI